jgi:hypothetical protein
LGMIKATENNPTVFINISTKCRTVFPQLLIQNYLNA